MKNKIEIENIYDFIKKFPEAIDYIKNPDYKVLKIQKESLKDKLIINKLRSGTKSVPPIVQKYIFEKHYMDKFHYLITDPKLLKIITCKNIIK